MTDFHFRRFALFGDSYGLPILLRTLPRENIVCLVAAQIRPNDLDHIKDLAVKHKVSLLIQPRYNAPDYFGFLSALRNFKPDVLFCNSYSMIIRPDVLELVYGSALNVHSALLPRNRGPNPIQWSLIHDEKETGVTIHYMNDTIDCGDIVAQMKIQILEEDTWVSLRKRLTVLTEEILTLQLPFILSGTNARQKQDESRANVNQRLTAESPQIDLRRMSNREVFNLIRAQVLPLKGAYIQNAQGRKYYPEYLSLSDVEKLRAANE